MGVTLFNSLLNAYLPVSLVFSAPLLPPSLRFFLFYKCFLLLLIDRARAESYRKQWGEAWGRLRVGMGNGEESLISGILILILYCLPSTLPIVLYLPIVLCQT